MFSSSGFIFSSTKLKKTKKNFWFAVRTYLFLSGSKQTKYVIISVKHATCVLHCTVHTMTVIRVAYTGSAPYRVTGWNIGVWLIGRDVRMCKKRPEFM